MQEATARRFRYREPVVVDRFSVQWRWLASGSGSSVDRQRQSGIAGFEEHGGQSKDRRGDCVSTRRCKANARHADSLRGLTTQIAKLVAPSIIRREVKRRGYVPIFLDGTAIEVKGKNFEGAGKIYTGDKALWLHAAFLGQLQVSSRLMSCKSDAAGDWRRQLRKDVEPLIPADASVWIAADNAYFRKKFVEHVDGLGWHFSLSVTDDRVKDAIRRQIDDDVVWTPMPKQPGTAVREVMYKPSGWSRAYRCIVIRRRYCKEGEVDLFYSYAVVMTSNDRLHFTTVLKRHWRKQGFENGFKGPLREMDLHRPPVASLAGNQIYYLCGLIAQMLLVYMQHELLPSSGWHVGLRPLIRDFMRSVAKLTKSGGRLTLKFGKGNYAFDWLATAMNGVDAWRANALA